MTVLSPSEKTPANLHSEIDVRVAFCDPSQREDGRSASGATKQTQRQDRILLDAACDEYSRKCANRRRCDVTCLFVGAVSGGARSAGAFFPLGACRRASFRATCSLRAAGSNDGSKRMPASARISSLLVMNSSSSILMGESSASTATRAMESSGRIT